MTGDVPTGPSPGAPRVLVVIPTYNEAQNVLPLTQGVLHHVPGAAVLVVDDGSPDGTGGIVQRAMGAEPRLALLQREGKLGLGTAYLAGFRHGLENGYDVVVTMDGDFSHDPSYLPAMLAAMDGHGMVIGSRYVPGGGIADWPWHRRALSSFANLYARTLLRLPVRDCTSGYRCHAAQMLHRVDPFSIRASGYSFLEEMVYRVHRAGFSIGESPFTFRDRTRGASKINRSEILRAAWNVVATAVAGRWRPPGAGPGAPGAPTE